MKVRIQLSLLAILLMAPCGGCKGAELREETIAPDEALLEDGMTLLDKKDFIESRNSFQTLTCDSPPPGDWHSAGRLIVGFLIVDMATLEALSPCGMTRAVPHRLAVPRRRHRSRMQCVPRCGPGAP